MTPATIYCNVAGPRPPLDQVCFLVVCETPGELRTGDVVPTRDWTTRLTFVSYITGVLSLYTFIRSLHCQLILIGFITSEQFQLLNIATINGLNIAMTVLLNCIRLRLVGLRVP